MYSDKDGIKRSMMNIFRKKVSLPRQTDINCAEKTDVELIPITTLTVG